MARLVSIGQGRADSRAVNWRGPYLLKAVPLDPWNRPSAYRSPGEHRGGYDLLIYGADSQAGGEGDAADITSWQ